MKLSCMNLTRTGVGSIREANAFASSGNPESLGERGTCHRRSDVRREGGREGGELGGFTSLSFNNERGTDPLAAFL